MDILIYCPNCGKKMNKKDHIQMLDNKSFHDYHCNPCGIIKWIEVETIEVIVEKDEFEGIIIRKRIS